MMAVSMILGAGGGDFSALAESGHVTERVSESKKTKVNKFNRAIF